MSEEKIEKKVTKKTKKVKFKCDIVEKMTKLAKEKEKKVTFEYVERSECPDWKRARIKVNCKIDPDVKRKKEEKERTERDSILDLLTRNDKFNGKHHIITSKCTWMIEGCVGFWSNPDFFIIGFRKPNIDTK